MSIEVILIYIAGGSLLVGAIFAMVGSIGLLKFDDGMTRLHAPTKVGTIGIGALLFAAIVQGLASGQGAIHEVLILAFLFVTAPVSANFIAKVHIHRKSCDTPPEPVGDRIWSTLDVPEEDRAGAEVVEASTAKG